VTGFLLTGIGERGIKGESNFLVVEPGILNIESFVLVKKPLFKCVPRY